MSRAWAAAVLTAAVVAGCQQTPTSVLLTLANGEAMPQPDSARLQVFDATGVAYESRTLALSPERDPLGTVVVFPAHENASPLRLHALGYKGQRLVSEGVVVAVLESGQQVAVQLTLAGELSDRDNDGVPDVIDSCPDKVNPLQSPGDDGRADACSTPAPSTSPPDAAPEGPGRDAALDATEPALPDSGPEPARPNGATCSGGGECEGGFCVDGVCCESDCTSLCRSCALPGTLGHCALVPAGEDPRDVCKEQPVATCGMDGTCDGQGACRLHAAASLCMEPRCASADTLTLASTCDGTGICSVGAGQSCSPFACAEGACKTSCASDADCAAGFNCVRGSCGRRPLGASCTAQSDCASGNCVDGVCCNAPSCDGPCMACNVPGSSGSCHAITAGAAPPNGGCTAELADTCGRNGKCDGKGQCQLYPAGTRCGVATCSEGQQVAAPLCDGAGRCLSLPGFACAPYLCDQGRCATTCGSAEDCVSSDFYCSAQKRCVRRQDAGVLDAATTDADEASPNSVDSPGKSKGKNG